jgi:hypothetical protein
MSSTIENTGISITEITAFASEVQCCKILVGIKVSSIFGLFLFDVLLCFSCSGQGLMDGGASEQVSEISRCAYPPRQPS